MFSGVLWIADVTQPDRRGSFVPAAEVAVGGTRPPIAEVPSQPEVCYPTTQQRA
jgi:hypothetical protein